MHKDFKDERQNVSKSSIREHLQKGTLFGSLIFFVQINGFFNDVSMETLAPTFT